MKFKKTFNKHDVKITQEWVQHRLYEQNGYFPRLCDIQILAMGGSYDDAYVFHPCSVHCRINQFRYQFFNNKLIEKVDCSEPAEIGFQTFLNYIEGGPADA